jgi:hypothetical protein
MSDRYPNPADEVLELGEPGYGNWAHYGRLGMGPEHLAEMIRAVSDPRFRRRPLRPPGRNGR